MRVSRKIYVALLAGCMALPFASRAVGVEVVISEFMAINDDGLVDEEGEATDWIEVYNAAPTTVDLGGWYLTDRSNDLTRWSFPSTNLEAGEFLVVFASGKDRRVSGRELHTSFKLDGDGEYLALVRPDGLTIASEFAPEFPRQYADISYGLQTTNASEILISTGGTCRACVPTDSSLGLSWTARTGFDDSGWQQGTTGVGFDSMGEYGPLIGVDLENEMLNVSPSAYVRIPFVIQADSGIESLVLNMRFKDGFVAYVNGQRVVEDNVDGDPDWDSDATLSRDRSAVYTVDPFALENVGTYLVTGPNLLAIHGLNNNARDGDFLVLPELMGQVPSFGQEGGYRYFASATPGRINASGYAGVSGEVRFSRNGGTASGTFSLDLTADNPGAEIRYTLDRTAPTNTSTLYEVPLTISGTTTVRARAYEPGRSPGSIGEETYIFVDPETLDFTSDLPIIIVDNLGGGDIPQVEPKQTAMLTVIEPGTNGRTSLALPVATMSFAGIRRRGESTMRPSYLKPNLAVEVRDVDGVARNVSPLGLPSESDWILFAPWSWDPAFIRNPFAFTLSRQVGEYASRHRFVEVFLNSGGGAIGTNDYFGVYVLEERIKIDNDRVDVADLMPSDTNTPAVSGGYIFRRDKTDPDKPEFTVGNQALQYFDPSYEALNVAQRDWLADHLRQFDAALNSANFLDPVDGYRPYIDVSCWVRVNIVGMYTKNIDWPRLSTYFHKDRNGPIRHGPLWDFDRSMESKDGRDDTYDTWDAGASFFTTGWFYRTFRDPDFWQEYIDTWWELRENVLSESNVLAVIEGMTNEIAEAVDRDLARWMDYADHRPRTSGGYGLDGTWSGEVLHLKWWLTNRLAWVDSQLPAPPLFSIPGGSVETGTEVSIAAPAGWTVYYTVDGSDPRAPGGGVADTAFSLAAGAVFGVDRNTMVRARATDGSAFNVGPSDCPWSALSETIFSVGEPTLAVTEVMYHPREPVGVETNGGYEARHFEFVELQNVGSERVELVGVHFTNGIAFDFTFSDARSLEPSEYVLVVDELAAFTNRYANWRDLKIAGEFDLDLSDSGERVELRSATGQTVSTFRYNDARGWPMAADGTGHSLVPLRLFYQGSGILDYGRHWRASSYIDGSPGMADPALPTTVVLNELTAHTDYSGGEPWQDSDDWIELFNASDAPVGLGGWYLSDSRDTLMKWAIPAERTVAGNGWIRFSEVDDFHTSQTNGFGLNKAGEEVYLSYVPDTGAARVVDCVRFKGQENDVSLGRYPDGAEFWHTLVPTEGEANAAPAAHVTIDEIMYHPAPTLANPENNTNDEYIEIHNPLDHAVPLWTDAGTWRIDGGVTFSFPSNTTLAAGERVLLVSFDPSTNAAALAAFEAAYGDFPGVGRQFGPYDGSLDNIGERVAIERPQLGDLLGDPVSWVIVDEVIYFDQSPWPPGTDGEGKSLDRRDETGAGRDPNCWCARLPSPGTAPTGLHLYGIQEGEAYFAPVARKVGVDVSGVSGDVTHVDFFADGDLLYRDESKPFECTLTGLTNAGSVICRAVAAAGGDSHTSQTVRIEVLAFDVPFVTSVSDVSATVNGGLRGVAEAYVRLCWGRTDGGADATAWEHVRNVGVVSNATVATEVSGLSPGGSYSYRFFGNTASREGWSSSSPSFRARTLADWPHRMRVSFDGYGGASVLTNFPALVRLGEYIDGFSYTGFSSTAAHDLRFMDETRTTALAYDVEQWDTNGTSCVWVRVPELPAGGTIWVYWGASGITSPPSYAIDGSTWSEGFEAVWHFHEGLQDAAENHGSVEDFGSMSVGGICGAGRGFDGSSAYAVPSIPADWYQACSEGLTVSVWARATAEVSCSLFGAASSSNVGELWLDRSFVRTPYWRFGVDSGLTQHGKVGGESEWEHVAVVLDGSGARGAFNGDVIAAGTTGCGYPLCGRPYLGALNQEGVARDFFLGSIDELRVADVPRSDDWLLAEYQTAVLNGGFASYEVMPPLPTDADDDGMADRWEDSYFGGTDAQMGAAGLDWDRDGASNVGEYVAGTDPTNAASCFRLYLESPGSDAAVRVSFEGVKAVGDHYSGLTRYYDLQYAPSLRNSAWHEVDGYTSIRGADSTVVCTNEVGGGYFRGRVRLE